MKNFSRTLIISLIILIIPVVLIGCNKKEKQEIDFRVDDGYIQWTSDGKTWKELIDLETLKGDKGEQGIQGIQGPQGVPGKDGKQVEFSKNETHILWRYKTEDNSDSWKELVAFANMKESNEEKEDINSITVEGNRISGQCSIVPNQTIDLTQTIGNIAITTNIISALRIRVESVRIKKTCDDEPANTDNIKFILNSPSWVEDENSYYFSKLINSDYCETISEILGNGKIGFSLNASADNSFQGAILYFTVVVELAQAEFLGDGSSSVAVGDDITIQTAKELYLE